MHNWGAAIIFYLSVLSFYHAPEYDALIPKYTPSLSKIEFNQVLNHTKDFCCLIRSHSNSCRKVFNSFKEKKVYFSTSHFFAEDTRIYYCPPGWFRVTLTRKRSGMRFTRRFLLGLNDQIGSSEHELVTRPIMNKPIMFYQMSAQNYKIGIGQQLLGNIKNKSRSWNGKQMKN